MCTIEFGFCGWRRAKLQSRAQQHCMCHGGAMHAQCEQIGWVKIFQPRIIIAKIYIVLRNITKESEFTYLSDGYWEVLG